MNCQLTRWGPAIEARRCIYWWRVSGQGHHWFIWRRKTWSVIIRSYDGLSPAGQQVITRINFNLLTIWPLSVCKIWNWNTYLYLFTCVRHVWCCWVFWSWDKCMNKTILPFLSSARSKLRLCPANHRPGYWSNLPCDWPSTAWAYSEQETENGPLSDCLSVLHPVIIGEWYEPQIHFYVSPK